MTQLRREDYNEHTDPATATTFLTDRPLRYKCQGLYKKTEQRDD